MWEFFWYCMQQMDAGYHRDQKRAAAKRRGKSRGKGIQSQIKE